MLEAVVYMNFTDGDRHEHGLKTVANILNEVKGAEIEVVCHGGGIGLLVKDDSGHANEVAGLIKEGVRSAACEDAPRDMSIPKEDLPPGVATVPSGVVEIIRKQQGGIRLLQVVRHERLSPGSEADVGIDEVLDGFARPPRSRCGPYRVCPPPENASGGPIRHP